MRFFLYKVNESNEMIANMYTLPMLMRPLLLNSVPKCGPDNERNVCNRGKIGRSCGRDSAERTMMVPNECATKDIRDGFKPELSI